MTPRRIQAALVAATILALAACASDGPTTPLPDAGVERAGELRVAGAYAALRVAISPAEAVDSIVAGTRSGAGVVWAGPVSGTGTVLYSDSEIPPTVRFRLFLRAGTDPETVTLEAIEGADAEGVLDPGPSVQVLWTR